MPLQAELAACDAAESSALVAVGVFLFFSHDPVETGNDCTEQLGAPSRVLTGRGGEQYQQAPGDFGKAFSLILEQRFPKDCTVTLAEGEKKMSAAHAVAASGPTRHPFKPKNPPLLRARAAGFLQSYSN